MFVVNFKLDFKKIFIVCLILAAIIAIAVEFGYSQNETLNVAKSIDKYDYIFEDGNYTSLLKTIHENIDANVNKTVKITGFVFRMPDFKEDYFVVGRNIIINNEESISGILCQSTDASKLADNEWIEVTGIILKGNYNGDMPVLKVGSITKVTAPANTYVENVEN